MTDLTFLVNDLKRDEGFKPLYDDATGQPIIPGYTLVGHPTAGFGFALDVAPLTIAESLPVLTSRAASVDYSLQTALPWARTLSEPRQRALTNMAYNLGVSGLLKFVTFLEYMKAYEFDKAADDLEGTLWFKQVGSRGVRLSDMIRKGQ